MNQPMNRSEAEARMAQLQDAATDGRWAWLLEQELSPNVLELLRQSKQIDLQVRHLEQQEAILDELIIQHLQKGS